MEQADQKQIKQMATFMISEAKEKALDIQEKGKQELSIETHRLVADGKEKVLASYEKMRKELTTKRAIEKSLAINKQRLEKIKQRQEVMMSISNDAMAALTKVLADQSKCKDFVTKLIVQGLLMLLESEVTVQCRQKDLALVKSCTEPAAKKYTEIVKEKSNADKTCKLIIDVQNFLPPEERDKEGKSCLGGVVLSCFGGKITVDNTIDARLKLVMEQDKPEIRKKLFV
ncbi:unnamed protein product [Prorocentrum cordatum]|uniref:V-type proton ATPase subunit E n=1 Tax=Prorocentrum cordatum TaxID=2364126 RepID=A0ABN9QEM6_9DINO|nr:unnamed protein product [Polarella glacialis]